MYVEIHDNLKSAIRVPASRVVVYDMYDNPISVVIKQKDGQYLCIDAGDKAFSKILNSLGINKTLVINRVDSL